MYQNADSPEATCGRAEPGQWMRGMLQIKAARGPSAVLICSIPLIHRGVPRQVARGALSVSFRVGLLPFDSVDLVHHQQ